ncbi:antitoxin [Saccharothrix isguenensis]
MGIGDKFDDIKSKAKDALGQHGDKADEGIDRVGQFADERTGGRHSDRIQQGTDRAKEGLGTFRDRDQSLEQDEPLGQGQYVDPDQR